MAVSGEMSAELSPPAWLATMLNRSSPTGGTVSAVTRSMTASGGSENVLRAFEEARRRRLLTVGLAGYDGGRMAESGLVDHLFVVPSASVHRIQEAQTTAYHVLWTLVQEALGP